jgi:hypothetical protein
MAVDSLGLIFLPMVQKLTPNIDWDATSLLGKGGAIEPCADHLFAAMLKIASIKHTLAELLGPTEDAITRIASSG